MARYEAAVIAGEIQKDEAQEKLIPQLQRVLNDLDKASSFLGKIWKKNILGLYIYGSVGVGKTYLMDLFYQEMQYPKKARFHFHHFMQQVDAQLRLLQGHSDPLKEVAKTIAKNTRVLCLDEFLVHDVAHAMILAQLLKALFDNHIVLIATANTKPDDLYLHGVQRARFLPAITLLKTHCQVAALIKNSDYRLGRKTLPKAYLYPINEANQNLFKSQFEALLGGGEPKTEPLIVQKRSINPVAYFGEVVWFEFDVICNLPRCQLDYLELAARFHIIFLSHLRALTPDETTRVILLIHFIDVLYDQGVRLIVSSEVEIDQLYQAGPMLKEFLRTKSRLLEMQSEDYLLRHQHHAVLPFETA